MTYANPQGEALLVEGYLRSTGGALTLPDHAQHRRLARIVADPAAPSCAAFALEGQGLPALAAMAMRFDPRSRQSVNPEFGAPQLMIIAGRNHRASFAHVDYLRDWFGLTPAEARLAATLAEGASLEDFAVTRGITLNAARFLLKSVFLKTETSRQPQLVAKLQATPLDWQGTSADPALAEPLA